MDAQDEGAWKAAYLALVAFGGMIMRELLGLCGVAVGAISRKKASDENGNGSAKQTLAISQMAQANQDAMHRRMSKLEEDLREWLDKLKDTVIGRLERQEREDLRKIHHAIQSGNVDVKAALKKIESIETELACCRAEVKTLAGKGGAVS